MLCKKQTLMKNSVFSVPPWFIPFPLNGYETLLLNRPLHTRG